MVYKAMIRTQNSEFFFLCEFWHLERNDDDTWSMLVVVFLNCIKGPLFFTFEQKRYHNFLLFPPKRKTV